MPSTVMRSMQEFIILSLMYRRAGPSYGSELVRDSKGTLKQGGIYVTLSRMADKGMIRFTGVLTREEDKKIRGTSRCLYKITRRGKSLVTKIRRLCGDEK